jgi:hypothetical protein
MVLGKRLAYKTKAVFRFMFFLFFFVEGKAFSYFINSLQQFPPQEANRDLFLESNDVKYVILPPDLRIEQYKYRFDTEYVIINRGDSCRNTLGVMYKDLHYEGGMPEAFEFMIIRRKSGPQAAFSKAFHKTNRVLGKALWFYKTL